MSALANACAVLALASPLLSCAGPEAVPKSAASALSALQAEIQNKACDNSQQCQSLGVGERACGGPERYLVWSLRASDPTRVKALNDAYITARRAENIRDSRVSNCAYMMDPGAVCVANQCVPGSAADIPR